jgi:lysophospholipase L1-like esterase
VKTAPAKLPQARGKPPQQVKFELRDGDRVVLLGNTLIESDQRYGFLETALTARYPDCNIMFRNLGWSGDTVWGEARAQFGSAADGFRALQEHLVALHPTVILVSYGTNESFAGQAGLPRFMDGLNTLLDTLDETHARITILSPLREENLGAPRPNPAEQNGRLALYCAALHQAADERGYGYVDLYDLLIPANKSPSEHSTPAALEYRHQAHSEDAPHLTSDEMHLNELGYYQFADRVTGTLLGRAPWSLWVHAGTKNVKAVGSKATDLTFEQGKVRLTVTDDCLPMPPFNVGSAGEMQDASYQSYASRNLQVQDLPGARYRLTIDGQPVLTAPAGQLSKGVTINRGPSFDAAEKLRNTINRKNQQYFNRWRPQNVTYLFLFRKGEQGQNAIEIPKFDPLIAKLEEEIAQQRVPKPQVYELSPVAEGAK